MKKSIFQLSTELDYILSQIEENDGEITNEIAEQLEITEQNFANKVDSYCNVINMYKSHNTCCKEEKTRINNIQKTKKNIIDRFKLILLDAVEKYGNDGKSGNKTFETATHKLYTKVTTPYIGDDDRINILYNAFIKYMTELNEQGILVTGENCDYNVILDCINANLKAEFDDSKEIGITPVEKEFIPYTVADLKCINVNVCFKTNIFDLFKDDENIGKALAKNVTPSIVSCDLDSDKAVDFLSNNECVTLGEYNRKVSLTIK